ncbi:MAG: tetratricopeptide repeat protein [Patescibacteria group bacterium]|jgi:tetratricopeptide (TPR) repeat protein
MKTLFLAWLCFVSIACGSKSSAKVVVEKTTVLPVTAPPALKTVRVFVAPFSDVDQKGMDYFSLGLALFANARLEELSQNADAVKALADEGYALDVVVGPHVLPEESAKLVAEKPNDISLAAIHAAAKRAGATHVLTGYYSGRVERWSLSVVLFEVETDRLREIDRVTEEKMIYASSRDVPKPERPGVQGDTVHVMLGSGIAKTFAKAGIRLPDAHVQALSHPQTPDIVSFINLSRSYRALLLGNEEESMKSALAYAENAVRIWPRYQIARRLYAWLLWQIDRPEKARMHYQEALKDDPHDVRALVAYGRVEIGTGQYDSARASLETAAALRPEDPLIHYWLGEAYAKLGRVNDAIARYEMSRTFDPDNLDTRRALIGLYASERRYADAVIELRVIISAEPENLDALYLLAACERALGHSAEAFAAYDLGLSRFPNDAKLRKIRKAAEDDGTGKFAAGILVTDAMRDRMEVKRAEFQEAVNDGTWLLTHEKEGACADGLAGSDYLLARERGTEHEAHGRELQKRVDAIHTLLKDDWGLLLTPDELALAEDLLLYEQKSLRDYREMRTAYDGTFKRMLVEYDCTLDPQMIGMAKIEEIRERNDKRYVTMPEPPKRDNSGISPVVPNDAVDNVTFFVENLSKEEIVLVLDGRALEPSVPPRVGTGALPQFSTPIGEHRLCHVAKSAKVECLGTNVRTFVIDEGLIYRVQLQ